MKKHFRKAAPCSVALFLLGAASLLLLQSQASADSLADVRVTRVDLEQAGSEAAELRVLASVTTRQTITIRRLTFDNAAINGVRVNVEPVSGPLHLRAGAPSQDLMLRARVAYRDLDSLQPLRDAVGSGEAQVKAVSRAELQLSVFQKIALLAGTAWAVTGVDETVPVSVPGGALGRAGTLAALMAAEPVWILGRGAMEWRRNRSEVAELANQSAQSRLVAIETAYQLQSRNGERATVRNRCAGILIGKGQILAPAEAAQPWTFDPAVAEAVSHGEVRIQETSLEIAVTTLQNPSRVVSLNKKQLRIVKMLGESEHAISVVTKRRFRIRFRNSDSNAVLLQMTDSNQAHDTLRFTDSDGGDWRPAAVMRLFGESAEPSLWLTEARFENGRYQLRDAADSSAFGSPLWIDGGIAGMLQDEKSAAVAGTLLRKLR